jgi:MoaA/NifB/PqqE/SkfB family radical SAM enzyme
MHPIKIVSKDPLDKVKLIVIYLGNTCNFDCVYCDRGYIESLGGQNLNNKTVDELKEFFEWVETQPNELLRISFHGGEPFLFNKRMDQVMEWLHPMAIRNGWKVSVTTNGSLVKENQWWFEKYKGVLCATVSYDFSYQATNRSEFDVYEMAKVLNDNCEEWKWQFVIPIDDPRSFSFDNIKEIVSTCYKTNCRVINIIPLRHKRGKDKFEVIIDRVNLPQFLEAFLQFIQILYIKKLTVFIDGCYTEVDKAYFSEHNKLILSPDGFIYPEFDFLEYKIENARIGDWKNKQVWKNQGDYGRINDACLSCSKRPSCGLKYLYHLFDKEPQGSCREFYTYMDYAIMHNAKLNEKKSVLEWVGIKQDFEIKQ